MKQFPHNKSTNTATKTEDKKTVFKKRTRRYLNLWLVVKRPPVSETRRSSEIRQSQSTSSRQHSRRDPTANEEDAGPARQRPDSRQKTTEEIMGKRRETARERKRRNEERIMALTRWGNWTGLFLDMINRRIGKNRE